MTDGNGAYGPLAAAITRQAVRDYRDAMRTLSTDPTSVPARSTVTEIQEFFGGVWFGLLSSAAPETETVIRRERITAGKGEKG
mgnify:CR=1 FL=1